MLLCLFFISQGVNFNFSVGKTNEKKSHVDESWGETKETSTLVVSFHV